MNKNIKFDYQIRFADLAWNTSKEIIKIKKEKSMLWILTCFKRLTCLNNFALLCFLVLYQTWKSSNKSVITKYFEFPSCSSVTGKSYHYIYTSWPKPYNLILYLISFNINLFLTIVKIKSAIQFGVVACKLGAYIHFGDYYRYI